jgi:hypothetical protein
MMTTELVDDSTLNSCGYKLSVKLPIGVKNI